eukprot:scaffold6449_cov237-Skeletonema_dohrnii-CCMP3373.AAC.10
MSIHELLGLVESYDESDRSRFIVKFCCIRTCNLEGVISLKYFHRRKARFGNHLLRTNDSMLDWASWCLGLIWRERSGRFCRGKTYPLCA